MCSVFVKSARIKVRESRSCTCFTTISASISEVEMDFPAGATSANGRPGRALHASWTSAFACPLGK